MLNYSNFNPIPISARFTNDTFRKRHAFPTQISKPTGQEVTFHLALSNNNRALISRLSPFYIHSLESVQWLRLHTNRRIILFAAATPRRIIKGVFQRAKVRGNIKRFSQNIVSKGWNRFSFIFALNIPAFRS